VFCEAKVRSGSRFGGPAEAVGLAKQARIRRLAARWLREHHERLSAPPTIIRFDVAAILEDRLEVLEAAF
jgi:putative endonuclease